MAGFKSFLERAFNMPRRGVFGAAGGAALAPLLVGTQSKAAAPELSPEELMPRLQAAVDAEGFFTGDAIASRYLARGQTRKPVAVLLPKSTGEVSAILSLCHAAGQPVVPQGGMTGLVAGAVAARGEVVISLERMDAVEHLDAESRTMTVQSGITLLNAQAHAADTGLLLGQDIASRAQATIGGMISTNAGGLQVIRYGMMRECVLGLEAVLADGTVITAMNTMIKNNAGYDIKQLFIGTEGTLGIVTRAVLRLRPKPSSVSTVFAGIDTFEKVPAFLHLLEERLGGTLTSFEVMWPDYDAFVRQYCPWMKQPLSPGHAHYVLTEAQGNDPEADAARMARILKEAKNKGLIAEVAVAETEEDHLDFWAIRNDAGAAFSELGPFFGYDVSMPISAMKDYAERVKADMAAAFPGSTTLILGHMGDGNIHLVIAAGGREPAIFKGVSDIVYGAVRDLHGSVSAEHGIGTLKRDYLGWTRGPEEVALMRTLKQALDPRGILNPGKVL